MLSQRLSPKTKVLEGFNLNYLKSNFIEITVKPTSYVSLSATPAGHAYSRGISRVPLPDKSALAIGKHR
jgi:hypothetical protein